MEKKSIGHTFENLWHTMSDKDKKETTKLCERYKLFLDAVKTEREAKAEIERRAVKAGFISLDELIAKGAPLKAGQKIYYPSRDKAIILAVVGTKPMEDGVHIVGSHIDSPRLDLKPMPLYEDGGLAMLKTHYYGGVKKYQWASMPLAMHGVVFKNDGTRIDIAIGEDPKDPVFFITDLLPHLAKDQMKKTMSEGITGEALNVVVGSIPVEDKEAKSQIKEAVLIKLKEDYNIEEADFVSAEIEIVPAGKARDVGLDRSLISAYGQDDRICAFTSLEAILEVKKPSHTAITIFADKEEVGSNGNTGSHGAYIENFIAELIALECDYSELKLKRTYTNTRVLSADVATALDPTYASVLDKHNAAYINKGICLIKYTGSGGKYSCNDANAEYVGFVRNLFDQNDVKWQIGELGKVDQGGGGTIAYILANKGADVVDCGPAVLSMHAPYELSAKADTYMSYKAYKAFLNHK